MLKQRSAANDPYRASTARGEQDVLVPRFPLFVRQIRRNSLGSIQILALTLENYHGGGPYRKTACGNSDR